MLIASLETSEETADATLDSLVHLVRRFAGQVDVETDAGGTRLARVSLDEAGLERLAVALALAGATLCHPDQFPFGSRSLVVIATTGHRS